jgi:hypothetical protein
MIITVFVKEETRLSVLIWKVVDEDDDDDDDDSQTNYN